MNFKIDKIDGKARACTIKTAHSTIHTPVFMPVGTVGAVKALDATDLDTFIKPQIILGNTYHLYLRPNDKIINKLGKLHGFTKFSKRNHMSRKYPYASSFIINNCFYETLIMRKCHLSSPYKLKIWIW